MANNRDIGIDVLKGLGIILMVIGHVNAPCPLLENFIFSFHMPLFFLLVAIYIKENHLRHSFIKMQRRY